MLRRRNGAATLLGCRPFVMPAEGEAVSIAARGVGAHVPAARPWRAVVLVPVKARALRDTLKAERADRGDGEREAAA